MRLIFGNLGWRLRLSAMLQLVAISVMAIFVFARGRTGLQLAGMALGCVKRWR